MKDLKCGLTNCKYNKGYCCCAKEIAIDGFTECMTYEIDSTKRRTMFEAGTDFIPANYSVDTKVSCSAKCLFNRDGQCTANGITVMGENTKNATCVSFVKK